MSIAAATTALLVNGALVGWFLHQVVRMPEAGERGAPAGRPLRVEFIPVPRAPSLRRDDQSREPVDRAEEGGAEFRQDEAPPGAASKASDGMAPVAAGLPGRPGAAAPGGQMALDLSVPPLAPVAHGPRDPFERPAPLEHRTTRFDHAWIPAGDAISQARFRSRALNAVLGMLGAPPRKCTEVEHRLLKPDCLPPEEPVPVP